MERIRYGIVGTGGMGSGHARTMQRWRSASWRPCATSSRTSPRRWGRSTTCPTLPTITQLIDRDDVDAVIVATPHYFHPEIAIYAMEHGKPVISEKPIAVTVSAADAMVAAAERTGTPFARHAPVAQRAGLAGGPEDRLRGPPGRDLSHHAGLCRLPQPGLL